MIFGHFWNCKEWNLVTKKFVKLTYLISRVFLAWTFLNFLAHCASIGGRQQERVERAWISGIQSWDVSYLMNLAIYLDIIHEQMQYWLVLFIHVFIKSELESDSSLRHIKHKINYIYTAHKPQVLVCLT